MSGDAARPGLAMRAAGVALLLLAWELLGQGGALGKLWPPLSDIVGHVLAPGNAALLLGALQSTATSAGTGLLIGSAFGVLLAVLGLLWTPLGQGLGRFAATLNAVPLIALGPVLIVTAGREATPVVIASITVFFGVFVAASSGLASASREQGDLLTVLGASRRNRLWLLQVPGALPMFVDGLRLSVTAAVVGAILGEWFGAPGGIGLLLVSAMQNYQIALLWSAALLAALMSLAAYGLLGLLQRWLEWRFR
jgi:NitT/TauT family transport system permease protein